MRHASEDQALQAARHAVEVIDEILGGLSKTEVWEEGRKEGSRYNDTDTDTGRKEEGD
jgi:formylmethanofuran:tetrahydromethanopterin formyltransferase